MAKTPGGVRVKAIPRARRRQARIKTSEHRSREPARPACRKLDGASPQRTLCEKWLWNSYPSLHPRDPLDAQAGRGPSRRARRRASFSGAASSHRSSAIAPRRVTVSESLHADEGPSRPRPALPPSPGPRDTRKPAPSAPLTNPRTPLAGSMPDLGLRPSLPICGCRVAPCVVPRGPHGSGRADFPHPALRFMDSLRAARNGLLAAVVEQSAPTSG